MKCSCLLAAATLSTIAWTQDAPITQNNPSTASLQAILQSSKPIQGAITGVSNTNGTGVNFNVNFYDFPATGGPWTYYIANAGVPTSADCSALTTPLNPYSAALSSCKASDPAACPIGSLSAKHGAITGATPDTSFQEFYLDLYLSSSPGSESYFGGRAIVLAGKDGVPVNCASFPGQAAVAGSSSSSSSSSGGTASATSSASMSASSSSSSSSSSSASAAATSTAAAVSRRVDVGSGVALVAAVAAVVL